MASPITPSEDLILKFFSENQQQILSNYSTTTKKQLAADIFKQAVITTNQSVQQSSKSIYKTTPIQAKTLEDPLILENIGVIVPRVVLNGGCNVPTQTPENSAAAIISLILGKSNWLREFGKTKGLTALSAILFKQNPTFCAEIQAWLQTRLNNAVTEIPDPEMRKVYIHHLLGYIPFFSPIENTIITVPTGPDNSLITYRLEKIDLTPHWLGSPMVAYGLVPINPREGELILLLKGTNYPTDKGFLFSLLADINPFACIGGYAFHFSVKNRLEKWLKDKRSELGKPEMKATVVGISLGGTLALLVTAYLTNYVSNTYAFVPPAVTSHEVSAWDKQKEKISIENQPNVNIYLQNGDFISSFVGRRWARDWRVFHLSSPVKAIFLVHAAAYSAQKEAFLMPINADADSKKWSRRLWPIMQNVIALPFFLIGAVILVPLFCIIHNIIRLAQYCFAGKSKLLRSKLTINK